MKRDTEGINNEIFDLLVIGGGIHGAVIAYKAAQKGLKVLLAEKQDFASASSSNSLKILHGGLRYLQNLNFRRMRDSVVSRREMMQMAPHLVRPLPCALPAYGHGLKGKEVMRLAMLVNDLISVDRNRDLQADVKLPAGYCISKQKCLEWIPGLQSKGLHGASVWYDALIINTERMVLEYILGACDFGATALNYLSVESLTRADDELLEASAYDHVSEASCRIRARYVINSTGAQFETLTGDHKQALPVLRWARALNIVVRKNLFPDCAVALEQQIDARKRMLFMVPWRDQYTLIGTHYLEQERDQPLFPIKKAHLRILLDEINTLYPSAGIDFEDISFYHAGLLPMDETTDHMEQNPPLLKKTSSITDHTSQGGLRNVFSINSIKYTTAPQVADVVLDRLPYDRSADIPGENKRKVAETSLAPESAIDRYLHDKYGTFWRRVKPFADARPAWLDNSKSVLRGEIDYFLQEEMAQGLDDIVFRRTDLGTAECPSMKTLNDIAQIVANEYSWSTQKTKAEIDKVLKRYAPLESATSATEQ